MGASYAVPENLSVGKYTYWCEVTSGDMTVRSNSAVVDVAQRELSFTFSGNTTKTYDGTALITGLSISPANRIGTDDVSASAASYTFDSADAGENKTITANGITLQGSDKDNYKLPETAVTVNGAIEAKSIADAAVTLTEGGLVYDGTAKTKGILSVVVDGTALNAGDYTVSGNTGTDAGDYTLTVTGKGNFTGEVPCKWSIGKASLEGAEITVSGSFTYDGTEKTPDVAVKLGDTEMNSGEYVISYSNTNGGAGNHTNAGTVTVTVTAKDNGNCYGSKTTQFTILPKEVTADVSAENKTYDGTTEAVVTAQVSGDKLADGDDPITISNVTGQFSDADAGKNKTVTVDASKATATVTGAENYRISYPETVTADINKAAAPAISYPKASELTYGQRLSESLLSGGSTEYGSFSWADGTTVPNGGNGSYTVVFIPSSSTAKNYEEISNKTEPVAVTVKKAASEGAVSASISGKSGNRQAELSVVLESAGDGEWPSGTVQLVNITNGSNEKIGDPVVLTDGKGSYTWTGLANQSYTVRAVYGGDGNYEATTLETTFDTNKKEQTPPPAFVLTFTLNDDEETYTATIPAVENGLYSFDGVNYSTDNSKTDCDPETEYTGYVKYGETEIYNESVPVKDTRTAPRLKVKEPVISPDGGSLGNGESVTVEITCGTSEAEIYYTTDGSDPATNGVVYTEPIVLESSAVVRAVAKKADFDDSDEAAEMFVQALGYTGIYDGASHGISVASLEGAVVTYGTAEGTYDQDDLTYSDAGTYTVYYRVTRANCKAVTGSETVAIHKRQVTVSGILAEDKVYDGTDEATLVYGGVVYGGIVDGDSLAVSAVGKFADVNVGEDVTVNLSEMKLAGPDARNYVLADAGHQNTTAADISVRNITVSITPNGGTYEGVVKGAAAVLNDVAKGDQLPVTLTYSGKANDGTAVDGTDIPSLAGTYTVTAAIDNSNYKLTGTVSAPFVVERAEAVLDISPVEEKTYGDEDFTVKYQKTGESSVSFDGSDESVAVVDEKGTVHIVGAGSVSITLHMAESDNYKAADKAVTVKVAPKAVTVTAALQSKIYGEQDPALTYEAEGLLDGDALKGELGREAGENAGTYSITLGSLTNENNPNYSISLKEAVFTIEKADQAVPELTAVKETIRGKADGTINGLTTAMEYKEEEAETYTHVDDEKMGFAAGTWNVRYAADENHNASQDTSVTIEAGRMLTVTFVADDQVYAVKEVEWDAALTDIPAVPNKEGFDETAPHWDVTDFTHIREDKTVTAVYIANGTVETESETKAPESESETKAPESESETKAPESESETKAPESESETKAPESESETKAPESEPETQETESESETMEPESESETKMTETESESESESETVSSETESETKESETKTTESETKKSETEDNAKKDTPSTGDDTNLWLWLVLLLASCGGMAGTVVYSRRKKEDTK